MKFFRERTFHVDIVAVISCLLFLTVFLLSTFVYYRSRNTFLELAGNRFAEQAHAVIEQTGEYLKAAQISAEVSIELLKETDVELGLDTTFERYIRSLVLEHKQIDLFYFGNEAGHFLQAAQLGNEIYTKYINRESGPAVTEFHYFNTDLELERKETLVDDPYDPRVRPWYKGVKESGSTYWTEPYIFHETGKPGITVACPVPGADGALKGVVAADITLGGLSEFLRSIDSGANGLAFILDASGNLVAYPQPEKMVRVEEGIVRNLRPSELKIERITQGVRKYEDTQDEMFTYEADGERHIACFSPFPKSFGKQWTMAILAPVDDFLGPLKKTLMVTVLGSGVLLLLSVAAGVLLARQISRPIEQLTEEVLGVKDFNLETKHRIESHITEIGTMNAAIQAMKTSLKAFRVYVPASLVRRLIASGEETTVGGKDRELTIFFSDIADFTTHSESMAPKDLMLQLSEYFEQMSRVIDEHKGTLDKFIGDSVMAFWGAPIVNDAHGVMACRAALACRDAIAELNREWQKQGKTPFHTRIGLHTGHVTVGNIGSNQRMNYSVIGDSVNLASRLESVNKIYGTRIIVSQGTYRYAQRNFICRILDQIAVKGKSESVTIYELMSEVGSAGAEKSEALAKSFNEAYRLYLDREWDEALGMLRGILEGNPHDKVTSIYINRCERYQISEPDDDWTGISRLSEK
jgi:adenylate cyclase